MEIYVSLFGNKKNILGWLRLLEEEKVPFRYKGENLENFSSINILVGFTVKKTKDFLNDRNKVWIIESTPNPSRKKLIEVFRSLDIPYIHLWYYPTDCFSIFLFRVDVDYIYLKGLENIFEITKKFKIKGTYFVNISGEEEFDEEIGHLKLKNPTTPERKNILKNILSEGNEIANHGYWHYVFDNFKENDENIKKCTLYLKHLFHVKDKGFCAPGGVWNLELLKTLNKNKFLYSCNTVSQRGEFPYYPRFSIFKSKLLEIPFYQVSDAKFESVLKSTHITREVSDWLRENYLKYIKKQLKSNRPIAIMAHPHLMGKIAKNVLPAIFRKISQLNIQNYSLKEFAEWWKKRENLKLKYYQQNSEVMICSDSSVFVELIFRKTKKILKLSNKKTAINLKKII